MGERNRGWIQRNANFMCVSGKRKGRLVGAKKPPIKRMGHLSDTDDAEIKAIARPINVFDEQEWTSELTGNMPETLLEGLAVPAAKEEVCQ
jgi:hypothetical protein